jgi:hypothetical protein
MYGEQITTLLFMPKQITTTIYTFDELSIEAKENARSWYREHALDYDWWDSIYDDAKQIGLTITGFGLDRHRHATGSFKLAATCVAANIVMQHGKTCETFKDATKFSKNFNLLNKDSVNYDDKVADLSNEFCDTILEDYSIILQHEYEWLLSDKQVDESILASEYTFTEAGKPF